MCGGRYQSHAASRFQVGLHYQQSGSIHTTVAACNQTTWSIRNYTIWWQSAEEKAGPHAIDAYLQTLSGWSLSNLTIPNVLFHMLNIKGGKQWKHFLQHHLYWFLPFFPSLQWRKKGLPSSFTITQVKHKDGKMHQQGVDIIHTGNTGHDWRKHITRPFSWKALNKRQKAGNRLGNTACIVGAAMNLKR